MSELWATRQRNTNKLVRLVAPYVLDAKRVHPDQLYGLCKLTWITGNPDSADAPYIRSTKLPALSAVFGKDFSELTVDQVAMRISELLEDPDAAEAVKEHTGFTNFYNAFRNTACDWIDANSGLLIPLFRRAFNLSSDDDGRFLVREIEKLDGVPKPNNLETRMNPAYLLTPAFFALDERLRFPLINGNDGVQNLLRDLGVAKSPLETQYTQMIEQYGRGGIKDAADLDNAGPDLHDFISKRGTPPIKGLLVEKPIDGSDLPLKDESDVLSVQSAQTISSKRLHNSLTNKLRTCLSSLVLYEGRNKDIMFDAMVKTYDGKDVDLLIEVKTSVEIAHVRMAVGQLYSYSYRLDAERQTHLAVLLPERPPRDVMDWLEWLDIGVLWFSQNELCTSNAWLNTIAEDNVRNEKGDFICPECGSTETGLMAMVSTLFDPEVPWSSVLQRITCAQCHFVVPSHLAERWNDISIEQARQEWREVYRVDAWQEDENER